MKTNFDNIGDEVISDGDTYSSVDGKRVKYTAYMGSDKIGGNVNESFMSAEGNDDDEFYDANGDKQHSNFWGLSKAERKARQKRKLLKTQGKADEARTTAQAQLEAAKGMTEGAKSDAAIAAALASGNKQTVSLSSSSKGMSKTTKIGIAIAVVALIGIGIVIYKKKHKK